ncbi:LysR family transcriptional regulator [Anaerobacillus sp. MEB173]|uniref:LysR family transcriptional regulator n=1 Tax=Anaerobacillus sp. MEB173 TaxID=3383345 RepID=UPI003F919E2D
MDNRDWEILHKLYQYKNITKTAESLYMTQPALTKRLKQIESDFQVQIVFRGRRGVNFTPEGEYLAKSAKEVLKEYEKIKEQTWNMDSELIGTLKIGVSNFITRYMLFGIINSFKSQFPNVDFKITTGWSKDMYKLVYNNDVHISFIRGDYGWQDKKHLLFEETICIVSKEKVDLANLPNLPRVDYQTDGKLRTLIDKWWEENYQQPPQIAMIVDGTDTCKEMVLNNLGYAILPSLVINDDMQLNKVDIKDQQGNPILRRSYMLYKEQTSNLNMVKEFVQFIENNQFNNSAKISIK